MNLIIFNNYLLNNDFNKLKEDLKEIEKKNEQLEEPNNLAKTEELQKEISKEMENAKEQLSKNSKSSKSNASQNQKNASDCVHCEDWILRGSVAQVSNSPSVELPTYK